ncbi:SGNH hydrolase [Rhizodiscina lignyota]|uniref:SGNH hydrolase n=1 Tax=Rhizodiscina lignyota TaxID=1504668 RepID=A0A9P4MBK6_9PEZI|nr:SGNH hydrolase [Rhizodiscina lignyota]
MSPVIFLLSALAPFVSSFPHPHKPPFFALAGDSTTAIQSSGGGGWGNGFLSVLKPPASGVNLGHDGATTVSFVAGGDWDSTLSYVRNHSAEYDCYVTIQFGHNDQKPAANISLAEYTTNLESLAKDVFKAHATPILVTPLSRRGYDNSTPPMIVENLAQQRTQTIAAAKAVHAPWIDLNLASQTYLDAIGQADAWTYNRIPNDTTHLNNEGGLVFGTLVASLISKRSGPEPQLRRWFDLNETIVRDLQEGMYVWPGTCSEEFC